MNKEAALIKAPSASYSDVNSAVTSANPGDIIVVPSDTAIWTSQLVITKGIYLIGAGGDSTKIISNYINHPYEWGDGPFLIAYSPSNYSANWPLRISGFSFDLNAKSGGIYFNYSQIDFTIQTKLMIDNNVFKNASSGLQSLFINGYRGVAYNNKFLGTAFPIRFSSGDSEAWWNNWEGVIFGKENNNFYFEDNTIECSEGISDCQYGNRYAFRYNEITASSILGSYPLMDMHGNQPGGQMWSSFGGEIYGNRISIYEGHLLDMRGGKAVIFCNSVETRGGPFVGIKIREEYCDFLSPVKKKDAYPQHVNDTYVWMNRQGVTGEIKNGYISQNLCPEYQLAENKDFWNYNARYNGTTERGIGIGTALPAKGQVGDGFWLTDQSYEDLTNYTGVNPFEPLSGTLFKYTADRGWVPYFTPLPYPHPLRELAPPQNFRFSK